MACSKRLNLCSPGDSDNSGKQLDLLLFREKLEQVHI